MHRSLVAIHPTSEWSFHIRSEGEVFFSPTAESYLFSSAQTGNKGWFGAAFRISVRVLEEIRLRRFGSTSGIP